MKTHLFFLAITAICLLSCNSNDPVIIDGGGNTGGSGGGSTGQLKADFAYTPVPPFTMEFTNLSSGAMSYKWDFGDGSTSTEKAPTHRYSSAGNYIVTLTAKSSSGGTANCRKQIMISTPPVYISGYRLLAIPYDDRYYKVKFTDDDALFHDWDLSGITTKYTPLLSKSSLPYEVTFSSPILMNSLSKDTYYWVYVYWSNNTSADGTQCLKQKLYTSEILEYENEYLLTSDNRETQIAIKMAYK